MAKIGLPSLKLNNAGQKSKSCGDFRSVAEEALKERKGHDPDIDSSKADQNLYTGYQTAAELLEYSRSHVEQLRDKNGRGIRKDAVVMCVTILKPPADFMNRMSRDDQIRFLTDAENAFADIVGRENIKSTASHYDELGSHKHVFWEPMTADGRLCAKEVHNLQFFGRVNRELPERLREAGWEIENCEMYDAAKKDYEQQIEKKEAGRSSARFKAEAEKQKQELQLEIDELQGVKESLEVITDELTEIANEAGSEAQINQQLAEEAAQEAQRAQEEASDLKTEISSLIDQKAEIEADIEAKREKLPSLVTDEIKRKIEAVPEQIESRSIPMTREKVMVNASDLERLERRAKLSMVHEEESERVLSVTLAENEKAKRDAEAARRLRAEAEKAKEEAEAYKQKAQLLYNNQRDLNRDFQSLTAGAKKLRGKYEELQRENSTLKAEIADLRDEMQRLRKTFADQIENLKSRLVGAYEKIAKIVKAVGMLKYDKTDGYRIEGLSRKQERIIDGVAEYAAAIVKKDSPNIAEDIEKHIGISADLQEVMEPRQRERKKSYEISR